MRKFADGYRIDYYDALLFQSGGDGDGDEGYKTRDVHEMRNWVGVLWLRK